MRRRVHFNNACVPKNIFWPDKRPQGMMTGRRLRNGLGNALSVMGKLEISPPRNLVAAQQSRSRRRNAPV